MREIKYSKLKKRVSNKEKEITESRQTEDGWEIKWNGEWYRLRKYSIKAAQGDDLMDYIISIDGGDE